MKLQKIKRNLSNLSLEQKEELLLQLIEFGSGEVLEDVIELAIQNDNEKILQIAISLDLLTYSEKKEIVFKSLEKGNINIAKIIIGEQAKQYGDFLAISSLKGYAEIVKILVKDGIDNNFNNDLALVWAAYGGHIDVVKILIEAGVDWKEVLNKQQDYGLNETIIKCIENVANTK